MQRFVIVLLALLLSACASNNYTDGPPSLGFIYSRYVYIAYDGPLRAFEDVGIVTTDGLFRISSVDNVSVNVMHNYQDNGLYAGGRVQLHLLPGKHHLKLGYYDDRGDGFITESVSLISKEITIAKGQVIHFGGQFSKIAWSPAQDGRSALDVMKRDFEELTKNK